jgi:hypothetical protein
MSMNNNTNPTKTNRYEPGDHVRFTSWIDGTGVEPGAVGIVLAQGSGYSTVLVVAFGDAGMVVIAPPSAVEPTEQHITSRLGDGREHAVPCQRCRRETWNRPALCDPCLFDAEFEALQPGRDAPAGMALHEAQAWAKVGRSPLMDGPF